MKTLQESLSEALSINEGHVKYGDMRVIDYTKNSDGSYNIRLSDGSQMDNVSAAELNGINEAKEDDMKPGDKDGDKTVETEAEFTEYATKMLKKAHGDKYDEKIAKKMIADFIKKYGDSGWGDAVGAFQAAMD